MGGTTLHSFAVCCGRRPPAGAGFGGWGVPPPMFCQKHRPDPLFGVRGVWDACAGYRHRGWRRGRLGNKDSTVGAEPGVLAEVQKCLSVCFLLFQAFQVVSPPHSSECFCSGRPKEGQFFVNCFFHEFFPAVCQALQALHFCLILNLLANEK